MRPMLYYRRGLFFLSAISLIFPDAARYRQDPRFIEIFTELGLVDYWKAVELPDFCGSESIEGLCP